MEDETKLFKEGLLKDITDTRSELYRGLSASTKEELVKFISKKKY